MGRDEDDYVYRVECGEPVRRQDGEEPCVLDAGHQSPFHQDVRALLAREGLEDVYGQAKIGRGILAMFGCKIGVVASRNLALKIAWEMQKEKAGT